MPRRRLEGISCPFCRKLVLALDDLGCLIEGHDTMTPCRHYIGMSEEDGMPAMEKGFEDLERTMGLLFDYTYNYERDGAAVRTALSPVVPDSERLVDAIVETGGLRIEHLLLGLPEVDALGSSCEGGGPASGGTTWFLFASIPNQRKLVRRLADICSALERLPPPAPEED